MSFSDEEVKKAMSISSLTTDFLTDLKDFTLDDVGKVKVNNSIVITSFLEKIIDGDYAKIKYEIENPNADITNLKLLKSDDTILSNADVYILNPGVGNNVIVTHKIKITEGV